VELSISGHCPQKDQHDYDEFWVGGRVGYQQISKGKAKQVEESQEGAIDMGSKGMQVPAFDRAVSDG
jgi:hypothetical protein